MGLLAGRRPRTIGVNDGRLQPLRDRSRNSVSSYAQTDYNKIAPLAGGADARKTFERLRKIVESDRSAQIVTQQPGYLYAEFKTKLLGFVDDVEFLLDPKAKVIHLRSASRLGREDFGVNRKRIEALRTKLTTLPRGQ
jgi:uncharacterized protein (DUF1499 family)